MLNRQLKPSGRKPSSGSPAQVYYPESDGKPLAESDTHLEEVVSIRLTLRAHFAAREDVYISGLNLIYYVEGDPKKCFSPDVYITTGIPRGLRRVYLTWVEGKLPDIAFEVTSKKTKRRDVHDKRMLYERLGIREYVLYDPEVDYLDPPFQLWRLMPGPAGEPSPSPLTYQPVQAGPDKTLYSQTLHLKMAIVDKHVRFIDPDTGLMLPLPENDAAARQEAEAAVEFLQRRTLQESNKRLDAEARASVYAEQAQAESQARVEAELHRADAEARRADAEAKALAEAQARADAEAKALAEAQARADAEAHALAEAQARADAEAHALAEAQARADAEARRVDAEARRVDAEARRVDAEAKALAEAQARADAEARQAEAEARSKALAERLQQLEALLNSGG